MDTACSINGRDQNNYFLPEEPKGQYHLIRDLRHFGFGWTGLILRAVFRVPPGYMAARITIPFFKSSGLRVQ
jgi:hypothetical protein